MEIRNIRWWIILLVAAAGGLVSHILFGFGFFSVTLTIFAVWLAERFTRWIYVIAGIILALAIFKAYLPQSNSKRPFALMASDLFFAKQVDSVQVKADVIWEAEKNRQKDQLLDEYARLLRAGQTDEAQELLEGIDRKFDKNENHSSDQPMLVVLSMGERTFHLPNVGDETPWIKYQQCIKFHVMINSPDRGYELVFSDGGVFQSTDDLPYMENPVYKIRAVKPNQFVTVKVTERS